ncbi:MAG: 50S ribosomal protein L18 [Candidatus Krumholzibacteriia bacterium]
MSEFTKTRRTAWLQRKRRVRRRVHGTSERPRLTVYRSNRFIYAQVVDDDQGRTLVHFDSRLAAPDELPEGVAGKCASAYSVGKQLAQRAKERGIEKIVFDRNGYLYHGRVAALARGARDGGLEF